MKLASNKRFITAILALVLCQTISAQSLPKTMRRLPDTGQTQSYTNTPGEDADFSINSPFFIQNGDGTVTDTVTGLMWQQTDGGEMTIENATTFCENLTIGGHDDWRLPTTYEAYSMLNHGKSNPALDIAAFTNTVAEYWWTSSFQVGDATKVWCTNAGGGIGNKPKTETISAGGTKKFNVRAVRDIITPNVLANHFTDNGDGTITDNLTQLVWQKMPNTTAKTWESALTYAEIYP